MRITSDPDDKIANLRELAVHKAGDPDLILAFDGQSLRLERTLREYDIIDNDIVDMYPNQTGGGYASMTFADVSNAGMQSPSPACSQAPQDEPA